MTRIFVLTILAVAAALAACDRQPDGSASVARPAGVGGAQPRADAPLSPDPGTYDGRNVANPRPPRSGLNADPNNPSGAPGNYSSSVTASGPTYSRE